MAKIELAKSAVDAAKPEAQAIGLRDTLAPGFLCRIAPTGRKVFMLRYRSNAGERHKPALGVYGELLPARDGYACIALRVSQTQTSVRQGRR